MPLKKGKSKATISKNISEMIHSATFASGKSKAKKQQMATAAALDKARESGAKIPKAGARTKTKTKTKATRTRGGRGRGKR
jgi:hypothetical protein